MRKHLNEMNKNLWPIACSMFSISAQNSKICSCHFQFKNLKHLFFYYWFLIVGIYLYIVRSVLCVALNKLLNCYIDGAIIAQRGLLSFRRLAKRKRLDLSWLYLSHLNQPRKSFGSASWSLLQGWRYRRRWSLQTWITRIFLLSSALLGPGLSRGHR